MCVVLFVFCTAHNSLVHFWCVIVDVFASYFCYTYHMYHDVIMSIYMLLYVAAAPNNCCCMFAFCITYMCCVVCFLKIIGETDGQQRLISTSFLIIII